MPAQGSDNLPRHHTPLALGPGFVRRSTSLRLAVVRLSLRALPLCGLIL